MGSYKKTKDKILSFIEEDWVALNDIVDEFMGANKLEPEREELLEALDFIKKLLNEEKIICLAGPEMTKVNGSGKEITKWILKLYEREGYEHINYGIWFDKKES